MLSMLQISIHIYPRFLPQNLEETVIYDIFDFYADMVVLAQHLFETAWQRLIFF
jgi:hypothetical protein